MSHNREMATQLFLGVTAGMPIGVLVAHTSYIVLGLSTPSVLAAGILAPLLMLPAVRPAMYRLYDWGDRLEERVIGQ